MRIAERLGYAAGALFGGWLSWTMWSQMFGAFSDPWFIVLLPIWLMLASIPAFITYLTVLAAVSVFYPPSDDDEAILITPEEEEDGEDSKKTC